MTPPGQKATRPYLIPPFPQESAPPPFRRINISWPWFIGAPEKRIRYLIESDKVKFMGFTFIPGKVVSVNWRRRRGRRAGRGRYVGKSFFFRPVGSYRENRPVLQPAYLWGYFGAIPIFFGGVYLGRIITDYNTGDVQL